ncbi:MAG TPA: exosome complex exonuclease Rrp41 [Candidatus Nanoarchaeia archaeon]|nr:exosome complex exonuclease Rrp41 [Candidatus Nanoarchaeia archaeon]
MSYKRRCDGRGWDEIRPTEAKAGVIPNADGSAYFRMGNTAAYCAVYGPRELFPKFLQNPKTGIIRCHYNMLPFSGMGERIRPGGNRRAQEISLVMEKALSAVVDLSDFPNAVVDIYVDLPETDAGSRCVAINAAAMALADAGIPMKDMVSALAVGRVDDRIVVDLCYEEEAYEGGPVADIPIAVVHNTQEIALLQMDGEISKEELIRAIEMGRKAMEQVYEIQKKALKEKYQDA